MTFARLKAAQRRVFLLAIVALLAGLIPAVAVPAPVAAATLVVTTTTDGGPGSLRQAIVDAKAGDEIEFDASLSGQTIILTGGELGIYTDLTITGPEGGITISGGNASRVFPTGANTTVSLSNLTIRDGWDWVFAGGIYNGGTLTITNSLIIGNVSEYYGGGIYNSGTLSIIDSLITGNVSEYYGGGIYNEGTLSIIDSRVTNNRVDSVSGGGIYNDGTLTVTDSIIAENSSVSSSGGISNSYGSTATITGSTISQNETLYTGGGITNDGELTISDSLISENSALSIGATGGGIYNSYESTLTIVDSTISQNTVWGSGGGIYNGSKVGTLTITGSTITENDTISENSLGGGIYNIGPAEISNSTISNNVAARGGGMYNTGEYPDESASVILYQSLVAGNTAQNDGGGITNENGATLEVIASTISNNQASTTGGGVHNDLSDLTITNSTISGNTAAESGGGIFSSGLDLFYSSTVDITNSTIFENTAGIDGHGVYDMHEGIALTNTIVAGSPAGDVCVGDITSNGHTLTDDASCVITEDDLLVVDVMLDPLADTGGPTPIHRPQVDSPAIDAADASVCPDIDQRGIERPQFAGCDIGAVEFAGIPPTLMLPDDFTGERAIEATGFSGATVDFAVSAEGEGGESIPVICTADFGAGPVEVISGDTFPLGDTVVTCTATQGESTSGTFTISVQDTTAPAFTTVPDDITAEATSPAGAVVSWTIVATDIADPTPTIICTDADETPVVSGNAFPLGTTVVTCVAEDASENTSDPVSFTVLVEDTTAPAFTVVPDNLTVRPTDADGALVSWTIAASDLVDPNPSITCTDDDDAPVVSGDRFAIGTTVVSCVAEDASGNVSDPVSFTVTVLGADGLIELLRDDIGASRMPRATTSSLDLLLAQTQAFLSQGNTRMACTYLGQFESTVRNLELRRQLSSAQAGAWRAEVVLIRSVVGCSVTL